MWGHFMILSALTLSYGCISNMKVVNCLSDLEIIEEALLSVVEDIDYVLGTSYSDVASNYVDYIDDWSKSSYYVNNGTVYNYTEMYYRLLRFAQSDDLISELNLNGSGTVISWYMTDENGNYTNETNSSSTVKQYGHNYFSDLFDWERIGFTGATEYNNYTNSSSTSQRRLQSSSCQYITSLPTYYASSFTFDESECGSVLTQSGNTCWAFACSTCFQCNYNHQNSGSNTFSTCNTATCTPGTSVGSVTSTNEFIVDTGICLDTEFPDSSSPYSFPTCWTDNCPTDQTCTCASSSCSKYQASYCYNLWVDGGSAWWDFLAASRLLATNNVAITIGVKLGDDFFSIAQGTDTPVSSICAVEPANGKWLYHAMTVVGVTNAWDPSMGSLRVQNSWGTDKFADDGYFWLSAEAFEACQNGPMSFTSINEITDLTEVTDDGTDNDGDTQDQDATQDDDSEESSAPAPAISIGHDYSSIIIVTTYIFAFVLTYY